eukprot:CAMPEP_0202870256 /NCGR_PEP_ID=MMETSP1391-20130828/15138_1 /ASSEMBLY_ACC=CAM_ASM_000867 /TAXON_ID=1034604 /ORGANISM="Chlamydomonas leiostraca, Strain SAG 11-49" /LENGTH=36 /DNA_ID= /DNA_START= /DNA_END= /DNA_ORIENTATION=
MAPDVPERVTCSGLLGAAARMDRTGLPGWLSTLLLV